MRSPELGPSEPAPLTPYLSAGLHPARTREEMKRPGSFKCSPSSFSFYRVEGVVFTLQCRKSIDERRRREENMRRGFRLPILPLENAPLLSQARLLCTTPTSNTSNNSKAAAAAAAVATPHQEAYRQLQNLDFMTAAKMLFTAPPQKKKFGIDFHLVQLFFACMPSLAVYLVAQYARYEIRRMEAEAEMKKKKAEEEEKAKEVDSNVADEEKSGLELSKVKVRLDALEETVKEIADETKKLYAISTSKDQGGGMKEQSTPIDASLPSKSEGSSSAAEDQNSKSKAGESARDSNSEKVSGSYADSTSLSSQDKNKHGGKT